MDAIMAEHASDMYNLLKLIQRTANEAPHELVDHAPALDSVLDNIDNALRGPLASEALTDEKAGPAGLVGASLGDTHVSISFGGQVLLVPKNQTVRLLSLLADIHRDDMKQQERDFLSRNLTLPLYPTVDATKEE